MIPEVKFIKDAQESNWLSSDEVEIKAVSKNMKHCTEHTPFAFILLPVFQCYVNRGHIL